MSEIEYKVMLLGDSFSGKTILYKKLTTITTFYPKNISTIGLDKKTINLNFDVNKKGIIEKKNFIINLYDTAGRERFRSITKNYYKGSHGIIIIYDITNISSFNYLENWINFINEDLGDEKEFVIFLIGNLSNLVEDKNREITEENAKIMCDKYKLIWGGEIDFKNIEIDELKKIFETYVKKYMKNLEKPKSKTIYQLKIIKSIIRKEIFVDYLYFFLK